LAGGKGAVPRDELAVQCLEVVVLAHTFGDGRAQDLDGNGELDGADLQLLSSCCRVSFGLAVVDCSQYLVQVSGHLGSYPVP
jgi:hypothetical protein